jgi:hypothetical protein
LHHRHYLGLMFRYRLFLLPHLVLYNLNRHLNHQ